MKIFIHSNIKLAIVIISILLIGYAWIFDSMTVAIIGAAIYLMGMIYDIANLIVKAKQFKKGQDLETLKSPFDKIASILEGILVISSLIAMVSENDLYSISGGLIWFGQIAVFILVGPIIEMFAKIPMTMTYGGWRPRRFGRKRK